MKQKKKKKAQNGKNWKYCKTQNAEKNKKK